MPTIAKPQGTNAATVDTGGATTAAPSTSNGLVATGPTRGQIAETGRYTGQAEAYAEGEEHIKTFLEALQKAVDAEDPAIVGNVIAEAKEKFSPNVWNRLEPKVQEILATIVKGDPVDVILDEFLGIIATGGVSGWLGLGGANVLRDPGEVPDFSIPGWWETLAKGATQVLASSIDVVGNLFSGFINVTSFGLIDLNKKPEHWNIPDKAITVKEGDDNYYLLNGAPDWILPLLNASRNSDGTFSWGGKSGLGKAAETVGKAAGLIIGPGRIKSLVSKGVTRKTAQGAVLNGPISIEFARKLNSSVNYLRSTNKAPGPIQRAVTDALFNRLAGEAAGYFAAYVAAEEMVDAVFREYDVQFRDEKQREDAQYWFGGNYITTMFIASWIEEATKRVPALEKADNVRLVLNVVLAELGTTGIIAAGTYENWKHSVVGVISGILEDAVKYLGLEEVGLRGDRARNRNHGGLIAMDPVKKAQMTAKAYRGGGLVVY